MSKINLLGINAEVVLDFHRANNDEMGNIKTTSDGKYTYISGQRIREAFRKSIESNNDMDKTPYFVPNSDGKTANIEKDITADMFGYLVTDKDNNEGVYLKKRMSPLKVGFAVAKNQQSTLEDLFTRMRNNPDNSNVSDNEKQRIKSKLYSDGSDIFNINASIDISELSTVKHFEYIDNKHVANYNIKMVDENERKRRLKLFLNASNELEFSNSSRSKNNTYPERVFIVFDIKKDGRYIKYYDMNDNARKSYIADLELRNAKYFIGDNTIDSNEMPTVSDAYREAYKYLETAELVDLSDELLSHEEFGEKYGSNYKEKISKEEVVA